VNRVLLLVGLLVVLAVPANAGATPVRPNFVGSGCSISTCRYFTSSYSTARYYYDRRTCSQWKGLSRTYLRGFKTATALRQHYKRVLHPAC
jgi:hypothetical protein